MVGEWRNSNVAQEAEIVLGFAFKSAEFATEPPGYRLVRGDNVKRGRLEWGDAARYWRMWDRELARYVLRTGDVVVGMDGSRVGENFARITEEDLPALLVQRVACLRARRNLDQGFLRYLICNPVFTAYIKAVHTGTSIPHISGRQIGDYRLLVPPLSEQRAIAHVLGTLDDKIELNRRMSETLEAMARALFKSWFVDFDPVHAKLNRLDAGLGQQIADFFPASFEQSRWGDVPAGWSCRPLGTWVDTLSGGTPSKDRTDLWNGDIPWISPKVMTALHADEAQNYVTERAIGNGTRLAPKGSTLVMVRGMGLHDEVRVSQACRDVAFNQDVKALVPRGVEPSLLLFALLHAQDDLLGRVESSGHGTGRLPSDVLLAQPLTMPERQVQAQLARVFDELNARIASAREESRTLTTLRDALLPKLLSGEVRVPVKEEIPRITL